MVLERALLLLLLLPLLVHVIVQGGMLLLCTLLLCKVALRLDAAGGGGEHAAQAGMRAIIVLHQGSTKHDQPSKRPPAGRQRQPKVTSLVMHE